MVIKKADLFKIELCICFLIWISAFFYASYLIFEDGKLFDISKHGEDFEKGWFLGYAKDKADHEWNSWTNMLGILFPWLILHIFLTEFTKYILIEALPICYVMVTNLFLLQMFGLKFVVLVFVKIMLHVILLPVRSLLMMWILNTGCLVFLSYGLQQFLILIEVQFTNYELYFMVVSLAWSQLKCASFSFEYIKDKNSRLNIYSFLLLLGYVYYLPLYFFGPLMLYHEFKKGAEKPFQKWTLNRVFFSIVNLLRYIFWMIVLDIFLHFFYIHALEYKISSVKNLGIWHLNGLGYLLAAFFCFKYLSIYGLTRAFSVIEGYDPPMPPRCVFSIYRNSQMWRTFDIGYYNFIKRYIYLPILGKSRTLKMKFIAAAITYVYVYIWHGTTVNIFWWSLLNFFQIAVIDSIISVISKKRRFKIWLNKFGQNNKIRLSAVFFSPLYLLFIFTNAFFYVMDGGHYFIVQLIEGSWRFLITVNVLAYCFCMTAIHINKYIKHKVPNKELPKYKFNH